VAHFCPACGASVGLCNNYPPWEQIASLGEAARSGVGPAAQFSRGRMLGYILFGLVQDACFAPLDFYRFYRHYRRQRAVPPAPPPAPTANPAPAPPADGADSSASIRCDSLADLESCRDRLDRSRFPGRDAALLQAIERRRSGAG